MSLQPARRPDGQALRMRRFLFAAGSYGLSILLAGLGTWWNFLDVQVLITYVVIAMVINAVYYGIFLSGLNEKLPDPSLTEIQIITAIGALLFLAYHAGAARGAVLLWAQLIFMFGIFRLNTIQLWRLAGLTWAAYGAIIYLNYQRRAPAFDLNLEVFLWLALGGVLAWFTLMGGYVSALRSRMRRGEAFYRTMWEPPPTPSASPIAAAAFSMPTLR